MAWLLLLLNQVKIAKNLQAKCNFWLNKKPYLAELNCCTLNCLKQRIMKKWTKFCKIL